ncbi:sigma factor-like helix-turn-helix DNA-binding protein [Clostridium rectalis]|uniref:sigma factor-like helix-turn-helix DNA-binding protein n=1 Tax=Clostridium rectalis TaxID=2040295 RepID=UPI000F62CFAF|nr:sigma factor-like helix-turn-helix DNA-binding protein [Clostridium rectalis]
MRENNYRKLEAMLYNYRKSEAEIENLKLKIREIENEYNSAGAISYEEKTQATNKFNSAVENEVMNRHKKISKISSYIERLEIQLEKIDNAVESLETREKSIVYMRYFDKKTSRDIAAKLNLTEVHVCRLKKMVINKLIPLILN